MNPNPNPNQVSTCWSCGDLRAALMHEVGHLLLTLTPTLTLTLTPTPTLTLALTLTLTLTLSLTLTSTLTPTRWATCSRSTTATATRRTSPSRTPPTPRPTLRTRPPRSTASTPRQVLCKDRVCYSEEGTREKATQRNDDLPRHDTDAGAVSRHCSASSVPTMQSSTLHRTYQLPCNASPSPPLTSPHTKSQASCWAPLPTASRA